MGLEEKCLDRMTEPIQKGDQEGQDLNKVERSINTNQRLGNGRMWQKKERKKRNYVSGAAYWVDHKKLPFLWVRKKR